MIVSISPLKVVSIIFIIQLSKLMLYCVDIRTLSKAILIYSRFFSVWMQPEMQSLKGPEAGTYLPKRMYNMNQKTEQLQDLALGLIPGCSDAKKTIAKLEEWEHLFFLLLILNFKTCFHYPFWILILFPFVLGLGSIISMLDMKMANYMLVLRDVRPRHW